MTNEISLKKALDLRRKSMSVGVRFMQEKFAVVKSADNNNSLAVANPKVNQDNDKTRNS